MQTTKPELLRHLILAVTIMLAFALLTAACGVQEDVSEPEDPQGGDSPQPDEPQPGNDEERSGDSKPDRGLDMQLEIERDNYHVEFTVVVTNVTDEVQVLKLASEDIILKGEGADRDLWEKEVAVEGSREHILQPGETWERSAVWEIPEDADDAYRVMATVRADRELTAVGVVEELQ